MNRKTSLHTGIIIALSLSVLIETGILFSWGDIQNAFSLFSFLENRGDNSGHTLDQYAETVFKKCSHETPLNRPSCYDKEIPALMDRLPMEDAFRVTELIQEKDGGYFYCHVLSHNLSGQETAKDPSKWKEVVTRCPRGRCSNGCLHGAFQERFRKESLPDASLDELKKELLGVCAKRPGWNPTGLERGTCYHALGHLAMYMTAADIRKSVALCDTIIREDAAEGYLQICYDGAFMQIFQPLEPEDVALVKGKQPTAETVRSFCGEFENMQRGSCWSESWPLFFKQVTTPDGLVQFCGTLEGAEENRCFNALFFVLTAQFKLESAAIQQFCAVLPEQRKGQCFANAAARFVETDYRLSRKAKDLCESATLVGAGERCWEELVTYAGYNFPPGSPDALTLCNLLPQPWNERCLSRTTKP